MVTNPIITTYEKQQDLSVGSLPPVCCTVFAQNVSLQPPPQQLIVQNKTIDLPAVYS